MAEKTTDTKVIAETTTTDNDSAAPAVNAQTPEIANETPAAKKKKAKRNVPNGQVHIYASFNNTIISITDTKGAVLAVSSAGACGFRGSKKGTAYAAQIAAEKAITNARQMHGISKAEVFIKGIGLGRESAVRALAAADLAVESIHDVTGVPHGGVRPKKARRV